MHARDTVPPGGEVAYKTPDTASFSSVRFFWIEGNNSRPIVVKMTPRAPRLKSFTPSCLSRLRIKVDIAGCDTWITSAPREKLSVVATAIKASSCFKVTRIMFLYRGIRKSKHNREIDDYD